MRIKVILSLISLVAGFALAYLLLTRESTGEASLRKERDSLRSVNRLREIEIAAIDKKVKSKNDLLVAEHAARLQAEGEVSKLKSHRSTLKAEHPATVRDSIVYLEAINSNCDSLVSAMDSVTQDLKKELATTVEKANALDTATILLRAEVNDYKKIDSLHTREARIEKGNTRKKVFKATVIGIVVFEVGKFIVNSVFSKPP